MRTVTLAVAALMAATGVLAQGTQTSPTVGIQSPSVLPKVGSRTPQGCFSAQADDWTKFPNLDFNSQGACGPFCITNITATSVAATHGPDCYCGNSYPPQSALVDDSNCHYPCPGYPQEACGGIEGGSFWSVYNTGLTVDVPYSNVPPTSGAGTSSTAPGSTVVVTQAPAPSGPNTGAIAAGVVVSVVAVIAIVGGVFFYLRRRRNQELEDEHHRNAAVNAFINGAKPPSSSGGLSMMDSRLDPVMANRRLSSGSIADNQDYSRKILRVTNA